MSKMGNKPDQQNCIPSHSSATNIQRPLYIPLVILSLFFTIISITHLFTSDKNLQAIIQVAAYISGITIAIILFLIAHNQRKINHSTGLMRIIFLYFVLPAFLIGIAFFSKIPLDAGAVFGIIIPLAYAFYEKLGKSKEIDIQENASAPSPRFIQENSSASIQNNSPISIQRNNNSPISIQNHITTNQNVTNIVDKQSEREKLTASACKMLDSKDLTSRISAVKTLVNLADSWLEDDPTCKKDEKKCQDIIDILCAHICRPFPLATKAEEFEGNIVPANYNETKFIKHQKKFREEQQVRRTIFIEMSKRSSSDQKKNEEGKKPFGSGTWSKFDFNFSGAPIFYPLNTLIIEKGIFTSAKFYGNAEFTEAVFTQNADFSGATFMNEASFKGVIFMNEASFKDATFTQNVFFNGATFTQNVYFLGTTFAQDAYFFGTTFAQDTYFLDATFALIADFTKAIFTQNVYSSWVVFPKQVYFVEATFTQDVYFVGATFSQNASFNGATFIQKAGFSGTTFAQEAFFFGATFTHNADFNGATFTQNADFNGATFTQNADFSSAIFTQKADFRWAAFTKEANFSNATFSQNVDFGAALFENYEPIFTNKQLKAQFSVQIAREDYNFSVRSGSKPIQLGNAELDEVKRQIPVGTVLFEPDSGRTSAPAKPIEESDNQGETPSK